MTQERIESDVKKYNIVLFFGGCDYDTIEYFSSNDILKESILFYTNENKGQKCKSNVYYFFNLEYLYHLLLLNILQIFYII